jgi:hypothetical protein
MRKKFHRQAHQQNVAKLRALELRLEEAEQKINTLEKRLPAPKMNNIASKILLLLCMKPIY